MHAANASSGAVLRSMDTASTQAKISSRTSAARGVNDWNQGNACANNPVFFLANDMEVLVHCRYCADRPILEIWIKDSTKASNWRK